MRGRRSGLTASFGRFSAATTAAALVVGGFIAAPQAATAAEGSVSGTVFRDYNSNGVQNVDGSADNPAIDTGVVGVDVIAVNAAGDTVATATTSADGTYTLDYETGDDSDAVRIEFDVPDGWTSSHVGVDGAVAGSSVRFAAAGDTLDFGVQKPGDHVPGTDVRIALPVQRGVLGLDGSAVDPGLSSLVTIPYAMRDNDLAVAQDDDATEATIAQTGSIWGVAAYGDSHILTAATLRRHAEVGPGGLGQIYLTEVGGAPDASPFVTIPNVGENPRPDGVDWFLDAEVYPAATKVGLGGIALSADQSTLFAVNLADRQLYTVPLAPGPDGPAVAGDPVGTPLPSTLPNGCSGDDVRPYGVSVTSEGAFVTVTCTGPTVDDLVGYLYSLDTEASTIGSEPVLAVPLGGYDRGSVYSYQAGSWWVGAAAQPWTDEWTPTQNGYPTAFDRQLYLSDVTVVGDGDLAVAVKDRAADRLGVESGTTGADDFTEVSGVSAGDVIHACAVGDGFELEANGSCDGVTGANSGNGEGPGGGEFYNDNFQIPNGDSRHDQVALGAVLAIPGSAELGGTAMDQIPVSSNVGVNGLRFWNADGSYANSVHVTDRVAPDGVDRAAFRKAGGLGDLDLLVSAAIEIGNRVWIDGNANGLQDVGEEPVEGVAVTLTCGDTTATTTTDANGEYYFNEANVEGGLAPSADCTLTFDSTGTTAEGLVLTATAAGENAAVDSDASLEGGIATIAMTTPATGADHTYDVGYTDAPMCSVGDYVWIDQNANGAQDEGEEPVPGVTVELFDADGDPVGTTTTDDDGLYHFDGLECGDYTAQFTDLPDGAVFTEQTVGGDSQVDSNPDADGVTGVFTLGEGATDNRASTPEDGVTAMVINPTIDAGIVFPEEPPAPLCTVGDVVWVDADENGVQDEGESPVPGTTVELLTPDGTVVATTETDENGMYLFEDVECLTYQVRFTIPAGNEYTSPMTGDDPAIDSNPTPVEGAPLVGITPEFEVTPENPEDLTIDAGIVPVEDPAPLCSVGDYVWIDDNANGVQDEGELPVAGVTVELFMADGTPVSTTTTDDAGVYHFDNLECGDFTAQFSELPEGSVFTEQTVGGDSQVDSNPNAEGVTGVFTLGDGTADNRASTDDDGVAAAVINPTIDAGIVFPEEPPAAVCTIGNYVWFDEDADGVQDDAEPGVGDVIVELIDGEGNVIGETVTNGEGYYLFDGLECGDHQVRFTIPEDYVFTESGQGDDPAADSNPEPTDEPTVGVTPEFTVSPENPEDLTIDGGLMLVDVPQEPEVPQCEIGDRVWLDEDRNGIQDEGEPGVGDVIVELIGPDNNVIGTVVTDDEGWYLFDGLECGDHRVSFTTPMGYVFTDPGQGDDPTLDSNPIVSDEPRVGVTPEFTVSPENPEDHSIDAGLTLDEDGIAPTGNAVTVPIAVVALLTLLAGAAVFALRRRGRA